MWFVRLDTPANVTAGIALPAILLSGVNHGVCVLFGQIGYSLS